MNTLALFNNKGGVGKTTLTFHLAHMASRIGYRVLVLDYDPQCNVTSMFLDEARLLDLWSDESDGGSTVAGCLDLVRRGRGAVRAPELQVVADQLWLLPGHLALSRFEQTLAEEWSKTMSGSNERALDVTTSLDVLSNLGAAAVNADLVFRVDPEGVP